MYTWPDLVENTMANAQMVAWGSFAGWTLSPLNVSIIYANIEDFTGHVATFFSVPLLASGIYAVIRAPENFLLGCPGEQAGRPPPACSVKPREANLSLSGRGQSRRR